MNQIAICIGSLVIYWSAIVIFFGVVAAFALAYSLYRANGGSRAAMWAMLPIAVVLGVVLSRWIHWYCHTEQYAGFFSAMTDYTAGDYCLPGAFIGVVLAVLIVKALRLTEDSGKMLDCLAPAGALGFAIIRMSAIFNTSCRGKVIIDNPALQRLPLASGVPTVNGGVEYRLATFCIEFIVLLVVYLVIMHLFNKRRSWPTKGDVPVSGNVALLFTALYGCTQVVLDSTRYDSSFLPINGFVSIVQIFAAVLIVGVMVYYTVQSVRVNGRMTKHIVLWVVFLLMVAGTGGCEYLVQRYGNMYVPVYAGMSTTCLVMFITIYSMYRTVCLTKEEKKVSEMNPGLEQAAAK